MKQLIKVLWILGVVSALTACPPKPAGECGGAACASTERCDRDALRCVADEPPVLTLEAPPVVSTATFMVTGTITDDDGVRSAEWRSGAREWTAIDLQSGGAFSLTVDAPALDAEDIVISLRARDAIQEASLSRAVKVDRVAPAVALQSPDAGSVHGTSAITVALVATDGSGALSELSVNGQVVSSPMSGAVVMTSVDVPASANNTLLSVPVVAADSRGNRTMTSFSFYGDRVAPLVTITSPVADQLVATAMMTVSFTVMDPSAVTASCANTTGATATATQTGAMTWVCDLPVATQERPETISVIATDAAGNSSTQMVTIRIDRVAPTVMVTSPTTNFLTNQALGVTVVTTGGATAVTAQLMGGAGVMLTGGPTMWSATLPIPQHDFAPETVIVEASDEAGNLATASVAGATDTNAPVVTYTFPSPGQRFNISSFAGGNTTIRLTWTVSDADPMASADTTFNGTPLSTLFFDRPTDPTDNPFTYSTNVLVVTDRAGNSATANLSYSVDRVAPTVASWTPAAGTRNVVPQQTVITFSEPMQAPTGVAVDVAPAATIASMWNSARTVWTGGLANSALQVVTLTGRTDVTDDHGNPLSWPTPLRLHIGTDRPQGNTLLATNVSSFDVASDSDGVVSVAYIAGGQLVVVRDDGASFSPVPTGISRTDLVTVNMNAWNVVDPVALTASQRIGVVAYAGASWSRWSSVAGTTATDTGSATQVMIVSRPGMGFPAVVLPSTQPFEGSAAIGLITNASHVRSPKTWTLPYTSGGSLRVVQSNSNWIVTNPVGGNFEWVRFFCGTNMFTGQFCDSTLYRAPGGGIEHGSAVSRGGSCLAFAWGNRMGFQSRPTCESTGGGCVGDLAYPNTQQSFFQERFATWDPPGEDTLIYASKSTTTVYIDKMGPGQCGVGGTATRIVNGALLPNATPGILAEVLPVRLGLHPAVVYLNAGSLYLQVF